ncbi:MAG TPA: HTTM domain-containing protein [Acidimicrobiia bacterium]|nr:HTTM domain-containing protein [Acidimicrobiia bacterium]
MSTSTARQSQVRRRPHFRLGERDRRALDQIFSIDSRALVVLRLLMAGLILFQALFLEMGQFGELGGLYGGLVDNAHLVILPFALMLLVGYKTRFATIICWLVYSLPLRADLTNDIAVPMGHFILNLALLWCCFLPLGRHLAVDSRAENFRPVRFLSVAGGALLFQIAVVYLSAGLVKDLGEWVFDATAMETILSLPRYETALGVALLAYPTLLAVMSRTTFLFEVVGALLVLVPGKTLATRRLLIMPVFVVFHVGIAALMGIGLFPYVMIALWLLFLPSGFWDMVWARFGSARAGTELMVDDNRWRNGAAGAIVLMAFLSNVFTWLSYPDNPGTFDSYQEVMRYLLILQRWLMFNVPSMIGA